MPAIFLIGFLLGAGVTQGVDQGAIELSKKPPFVEFHGSKADVKPAWNDSLNK